MQHVSGREFVLNGCQIKKTAVPKMVFKFTLSFLDPMEQGEIYKLVRNIFSSVLLNSPKEPILQLVSWKEPKVPSDVSAKIGDCKEIDLEDIPIKKQEDLVSFFLRRELKIIDQLNKYLSLSKQKYGDMLALPEVKRVRVVKINGSFYLFFDVGYFVRSLKSVYELVREERITYDELKGKEILYNPRGTKFERRSRIKVLDVEYDLSQSKLEEIKKYMFEQYGMKIDPSFNGPLLRVQFRGETYYSVFPQCCFLEKRDFTNKLSISNERRKNILEKIANNIDILDDKLLSIEGKEFKAPSYIVRTKYGKLKKVDTLKETIKYPAIFVPESLCKQKEIPIFFLVDERIPVRELSNFLKDQINNGYFKVTREGNPISFKLIRSNEKQLFFFVDFKNFRLPEEIKNKIRNSPNYVLSFAVCITKDTLGEEYDKAKRKLFSNGIISQFVVYDKWKKSKNPKFTSQNLVLNIYTKLGIRQFTLSEKFPYDYIIGVDVGNDRFNKRSKAGGVSVFLSNGMFKTMFPLYTDTGGEKIDFLGEMLEILVEKLEIENKKILIIRDGNIYDKELESIASSYITKENALSITVVNVKKNHSFRILSDTGRRAVVLNENLAVLLPHSFEGARSLLVDALYKIENGTVTKIPITYNLLSVLYKLTKINLSTIFREECMFRLPAPSHYSDGLVKSLGKGWKVDENLLSLGSLYFL